MAVFSGSGLMKMASLMSRISGRNKKHAIIFGAGSAEYSLYLKLEREKEYTVLFFIDEEPWNHRMKIGNAELRYPSELTALCENFHIDAVFFCRSDLPKPLPQLNCEIVLINA